MNIKHLCYLVILAAIWGASFSLIKIASADFGAFALAFTRIFLAAIFLVVVSFFMGRAKSCYQLISNKEYRTHLLISGLFGQLLPFILYAQAELTITASNASILNATTPFWTAIIAFFWLHKRFSSTQIFGMILGFIGVVILISKPFEQHESAHIPQTGQIIGSLSILLATLCYGYGSNYLQKYLNTVHPLDVATTSTVIAAITGLPMAIYFWPENTISYESWEAIILLGTVCTGFAFILFFDIISKTSASFAVSVTFLIPIFGVLWGVHYLDETISLTMIISMMVILLGVTLSNSSKKA